MSQAVCRCLMTLLALGFTLTSAARTPEALPQVTTEARALNSLLGKWNFVWHTHNPQHPTAVGTWTFNRAADGYMVTDEFRARADDGSGVTAFLGETYRAFDPAGKAWHFQATQYVSPKYGKSGEWQAGTTTFGNGEIVDEIVTGPTTTRFRFYNIKQDSFTVVGETSKDDGKTWTIVTTIECRRAQE
jgi:hypothetical protein